MVDEILLTTNGTQLKKNAPFLSSFGIKRINVSLDSLISEKYSFITNGGDLSNVIDGIYDINDKGIDVKINTVLLKNFNEDEILELVEWSSKNNFSLSFIEVMPIGDLNVKRINQYLPVEKAKK